MLNISQIGLKNNYTYNTKSAETQNRTNVKAEYNSVPMKRMTSNNWIAYQPAFSSKTTNQATKLPSEKKQLSVVKSKIGKEAQSMLRSLEKKGILTNNNSNDGSTVLENLYSIATESRIPGLSDTLILSEVIKALDNPASITQKFGDIPNEVATQISNETGKQFPEEAKNVISSSCVVASMEYNLASKNPAEFARFAKGLSSQDYSVNKKIKMSDLSGGLVNNLWRLREFNTEFEIGKNWNDVNIKIKPDRNAIVRARVQSSYKDPGERSCVDVLIQSALLNLCSQNTYDAITDERTGKFNTDNSGLTDFEKNFGEEIVFEKPKVSVVYQVLDENGYLTGYNCDLQEMKQHILKSLELGENVIIGYTHLDNENRVNGGHEITITDYKQDKNGNGYFICNDTDDNNDQLVEISEAKLLPLIHHAGIPQAALNKDDVVVEPWRDILDQFQAILLEEKQQTTV